MDFAPYLVEYADARGHTSVSFSSQSSLVDNYHHDFVSFLAIAQQLRIDFMPITWQAALGALGQGGTSLVEQSNAIKAKLAFAFKRNLPSAGDNYQDDLIGDEKKRFRVLLSELLVLGHPAIRNHPNISQLEGIAWDFEGDRVWPVLVSQRAPFWSLFEFARSEDAKAVSFTNKISMCLDIAAAVCTMHWNSKFLFSASSRHLTA